MKKEVIPQHSVCAHPHILTILPVLSLYLAAFIVLLAVAVYIFAMAPEDPLLQIMANTMAILAGAAFLLTYAEWRLRLVEVTSQRIAVRRGWLRTREDMFKLQTTSVHFEQMMWERLVDMGTLVVTPVNGEEMRLTRLNNFDAIRQALAHGIDRRQSPW